MFRKTKQHSDEFDYELEDDFELDDYDYEDDSDADTNEDGAYYEDNDIEFVDEYEDYNDADDVDDEDDEDDGDDEEDEEDEEEYEYEDGEYEDEDGEYEEEYENNLSDEEIEQVNFKKFSSKKVISGVVALACIILCGTWFTASKILNKKTSTGTSKYSFFVNNVEAKDSLLKDFLPDTYDLPVNEALSRYAVEQLCNKNKLKVADTKVALSKYPHYDELAKEDQEYIKDSYAWNAKYNALFELYKTKVDKPTSSIEKIYNIKIAPATGGDPTILNISDKDVAYKNVISKISKIRPTESIANVELDHKSYNITLNTINTKSAEGDYINKTAKDLMDKDLDDIKKTIDISFPDAR